MKNRLGDLFLSFQTKGFMSIEIPGLMQDVFNIIGKSRYSAIYGYHYRRICERYIL
jgi:hypothetical protein